VVDVMMLVTIVLDCTDGYIMRLVDVLDDVEGYSGYCARLVDILGDAGGCSGYCMRLVDNVLAAGVGDV
jgi:hypothetical protein